MPCAVVQGATEERRRWSRGSAAAAEPEPGAQDVASSALSAPHRLWLCWVDMAALRWQEPAEHSPSQQAAHHPLRGCSGSLYTLGRNDTEQWAEAVSPCPPDPSAAGKLPLPPTS